MSVIQGIFSQSHLLNTLLLLLWEGAREKDEERVYKHFSNVTPSWGVELKPLLFGNIRSRGLRVPPYTLTTKL